VVVVVVVREVISVAHALGCPRRRQPHPTPIIGSELKLRRLDEATVGLSDRRVIQLGAVGVLHDSMYTSGSDLIITGEKLGPKSDVWVPVLFATAAEAAGGAGIAVVIVVVASVVESKFELEGEAAVVVAMRHARAPRTAGWEFVCCEIIRLDTAGSIDVPTVRDEVSLVVGVRYSSRCRPAAMERGPAVTHDLESKSLSMALESAGAGLPPSAASSSS